MHIETWIMNEFYELPCTKSVFETQHRSIQLISLFALQSFISSIMLNVCLDLVRCALSTSVLDLGS